MEGPQVISNSDSLLSFVIPELSNLKSFLISVSTANQEAISKDSIFFIPPTITHIIPEEIVLGDTIEILGKYFGYREGLNSVTINDLPLNVLDTDSTKITLIVPVISEPINIKLSNSVGQFDENNSLKILPPAISSISKSSGFIGDELSISGSHFGCIQSGINVYFNGNEATITASTTNEITVNVPLGVYDSRFPDISVVLASKADTVFDQFEILDSWIRKADIPSAQSRYGSVGFAIGDYGYVGLGNEDQSFWKYDPESNTWSKIADFPGSKRYFASVFVIDDFAFVGGGDSRTGSNVDDYTDFWKYSAINDSWEQVADFPYPISRAVGLSNNGKGYITTRNDVDNFWTFDPMANEWSQLADLTTISAGAKGKADAGFAIDDNLYIYASGNSTGLHQLYEYDLNNSVWTRKEDMIRSGIRSGAVGFTDGSNGYIAVYYFLYTYNNDTDNWSPRFGLPNVNPNVVVDREESVGFYLDGKLYFGSGLGEYDFHEYDENYR